MVSSCTAPTCARSMEAPRRLGGLSRPCAHNKAWRASAAESDPATERHVIVPLRAGSPPLLADHLSRPIGGGTAYRER